MLVYTLSIIKNSMHNYRIQMVYSSEEEAWKSIEDQVNMYYKQYEPYITDVDIRFRSLYLAYVNEKSMISWVRFEIECFNMKVDDSG